MFSSQRRTPVGWWTAAPPLPKTEAEEALGLGSAAGARKPRPPRDRKAERLRYAASSILSGRGCCVYALGAVPALHPNSLTPSSSLVRLSLIHCFPGFEVAGRSWVIAQSLTGVHDMLA